MVTAVVLLSVERARIKEVGEQLAAFPEVAEVYSVAGKFDLVAIVRVRRNEELADLVTDRMVKLPGISHTETLIAFRAYSRADVESTFTLGGAS
ncbi:MAG: Lrp/AsnC ligand binding domain-containing protein [Gemmatimonadales bacterium]|jgi:DNA-binding Lrp family transcriptional regulator|nr:Lrp/AsnC ligand binding domain-containing protein [Gemmatimonadales bacterium]